MDNSNRKSTYLKKFESDKGDIVTYQQQTKTTRIIDLENNICEDDLKIIVDSPNGGTKKLPMPSINGVKLIGNKTTEELGITSSGEEDANLSTKMDKENPTGSGLLNIGNNEITEGNSYVLGENNLIKDKGNLVSGENNINYFTKLISLTECNITDYSNNEKEEYAFVIDDGKCIYLNEKALIYNEDSGGYNLIGYVFYLEIYGQYYRLECFSDFKINEIVETFLTCHAPLPSDLNKETILNFYNAPFYNRPRELSDYDTSNNYIFGNQNVSTSTFSTILGNYNFNSGMFSYIEGHSHQNNGSNYIHLEGTSNISYFSSFSHLEGDNNELYGCSRSHVEGSSNYINSEYSHVEGAYNKSSANYSHIEGCENKTVGELITTLENVSYNLTERIFGTKILEISGFSKNTFSDYTGHIFAKIEDQYYESIECIGLREYGSKPTSLNFIYYDSTVPQSTTVKFYSIIPTYDDEYNKYIHIEGNNNIQTGTCNHSEGNSNYGFLGEYNHVEGFGNVNSGSNNHVENTGNVNSGYNSHVEGYQNFNIASYSHVEGVKNNNEGGDDSPNHIEGENNSNMARCAHIEGSSNINSSNCSHIEGYQNYSSYPWYFGEFEEYYGGSHIEGNGNINFGLTSHIEGVLNLIDPRPDIFRHNSSEYFKIKIDSYDKETNTILSISPGDDYNVSRNISGPNEYNYFSNIDCRVPTQKVLVLFKTDFSEKDPSISPLSDFLIFSKQGEVYVLDSGEFPSDILKTIEDGKTYVALENTNDNLNAKDVVLSTHVEGEYNLSRSMYGHVEGYGNIVNGIAKHVSGKYNKISCDRDHNSDNNDLNTQLGDAFIIGNGTSNSRRSNALRITYEGDILATKAYHSSGDNYAEFIYEWFDGNPDNEDRVGYFVTVREQKLYKATREDIIVGITSGNPSIVGNSDEDYHGRWERDEFNRVIWENTTNSFNGKTITNGRMKLSKTYDPTLQFSYIPRKERPEWDYVGMVGVIPVRDDSSCVVNKFCKCNDSGVATFADVRSFDTFLVVERVSNNVVKVIMK